MARGSNRRRGHGGGTEPSDASAPVPDERAAAPRKRPHGEAADPGPPAGVTPSMAQFLEIKAANPDCMLFYRMGDFYELFFADAVAAAEALGIVLTKRGKHLGEDIPMCGVPIHRADEYLQRLIRQGFRVAVCEQLEDPAEARKRGSKAVVRRDVVRLVTPGTLTEDSLLDAKARNYLTAIFAGPKPRRRRIRHDRARLARPLDRRVRGGRGAGGRLPRRDRAPLAWRGDRRRPPARRRALEVVDRHCRRRGRRRCPPRPSTAWPASGSSRPSSALPTSPPSPTSPSPSLRPSARSSSTSS